MKKNIFIISLLLLVFLTEYGLGEKFKPEPEDKKSQKNQKKSSEKGKSPKQSSKDQNNKN